MGWAAVPRGVSPQRMRTDMLLPCQTLPTDATSGRGGCGAAQAWNSSQIVRAFSCSFLGVCCIRSDGNRGATHVKVLKQVRPLRNHVLLRLLLRQPERPWVTCSKAFGLVQPSILQRPTKAVGKTLQTQRSGEGLDLAISVTYLQVRETPRHEHQPPPACPALPPNTGPPASCRCGRDGCAGFSIGDSIHIFTLVSWGHVADRLSVMSAAEPRPTVGRALSCTGRGGSTDHFRLSCPCGSCLACCSNHLRATFVNLTLRPL